MSKLKKYVVSVWIFSLCINMFSCSTVKNDLQDNIKNSEKVLINENHDEDIEKKLEENVEEYKEGKYPIDWDLSLLYNNNDEFEKDFDRMSAFVATISDLKGTINNADGIYNYIQLVYEGYIPKLYGKMITYIFRGKDLDTTNSAYLNMYSKMIKLSTDYDINTAFFEDEMNKISTKDLNKIFEDERLIPYKYNFKSYFDETRPKYKEETIKVLSQAESNYGASENVFNAIQYADIKYKKYIMPNGKEKEVDDKLFDEVCYGDYDRGTKEEVEELFYNANEDYINALTSILYNNMKEVHNNVLLENRDSVLEAVLKDTNIDKKIYDNIITATHKLVPHMQKFFKIKKERLGHDKMHYMDVMAPYSKYNITISYDDAVDMIRDTLRILGDEYIEKYDEMVSNKHIDVYPKSNKVGGGYTTQAVDENIKPFVLLNYTGVIKEVKNIAHELGHAIFYIFSIENVKELSNTSPSIFLQEVASTFNENLFTFYNIDHAKSDEEKLYFIEDKINTINSGLIRQILYSEFEDWLYKKVENGENFGAEELCDKWMELHKEYYGDAVEFTKSMRYRWASIPHFYSAYYVYKYATSETYSDILAKAVYNKEEGALERYISFLKGGETEEPDKILKKAGIDVFDTNTYDTLVKYYAELIDQFEELTKK